MPLLLSVRAQSLREKWTHIVLRESEGPKEAELAKAESLAETNRELIIRSWHEHFDQP